MSAAPDGAAAGARPTRVLFVLPGLHRVRRGAEAAFESVAAELARRGDFDVTLIGSGEARAGTPYRFLRAPCIDRARFERFPNGPLLRSETVYEELTFVPGLLRRYRRREYDVTLTCSYPFINWILRASSPLASRPAHVFVTENGDWPCFARNSEYRAFACDGLVCVNPDHYERNRARWRCALIPNGVDPTRFSPGPAQRETFGIPSGAQVVLMVSALIPSKRVVEGIRAVAAIEGCHLVVAGDGPERAEVDHLGGTVMAGRFRRVGVAREDMPSLYRSCDAFLHMSKGESSPNAFTEALAMGLPIVAHDEPAARWMFEDRAILVDTDRSGDVTRALAQALGTGAGGREARVELARRRFAWSGIAGQYAEFLERVLADRADRGRSRVAAPESRQGVGDGR